MKKILIIHHCGSYGGAGVSLEHIVKSIDKDKYDVTVYCPSIPSEMITQLDKYKIKIIKAYNSPAMFSHFNGAMNSMGVLINIKNIFDIKKDSKHIEELIIKVKPDIVAVNSMTLFWVGKVAAKFNVTKICFHREAYKRGVIGLRSEYIKYMLNKYFDKLIFISNYEMKETKAKHTYTKCIYDKVEVDEFQNNNMENCKKNLGFSNSCKYILYLGGMNPLKGAHIIIKSLKYIKYDNYKLIFLQYSPKSTKKKFSECIGIKNKVKWILGLDYEKKVLKYILKNNLQEKIIFRPNTTDVSKYYKACDVIVFPSTSPHQARPIYEAGVSRIPIIITKFKNTEEFVKNGENGYEFERGNSKELANIIELILSEKIDIKEVVDNNYKKAMINHNIEDLYKEINDMLEDKYD